MFKKIQNYLLLHHPLLWNTKFVPVLITALIINIIFFIWGYSEGAINFYSIDYDYYDGFSHECNFYAVIISILVFILWLVFYFRNNAFKSFYPKKNSSLFKEWIIIAVLCLLNISYTFSYHYAHDLRGRNYFDREEVERRCTILSEASIFIDGSFRHYENDETKTLVNENYYPELRYYGGDNDYYEGSEIHYNIKNPNVYDSVCYFGKMHPFISLINKQTSTYSILGHERDSILNYKVKGWLLQNKKDSVVQLFRDFLDIQNEYALKANITAEQWIDLVYNPPVFDDYYAIGAADYSYITGYEYPVNVPDRYDRKNNEAEKNTKDNIITTNKYGDKVILPRYYVSFKQLDYAYNKISRTWISPFDFKYSVAYLYVAFAFSLIIFSFRISTIRNWFIAVISTGIIGFIIFALVMSLRKVIREIYSFDEGILLMIIFLIILIAVYIIFFTVYKNKSSKKITSIFVNIMLWLSPCALFIIYGILHKIYVGNHYYEPCDSGICTWLKEFEDYIFFTNLIFAVFYMYPLTMVIKKWKGIAEA